MMSFKTDTAESNNTQLPVPHPFGWQSNDGLTLAGVEWVPAPMSDQHRKIPILCLPGLSRNTRDFNDIALYLQKFGHRVIALDYRGRGLSHWDPNWENYTLPMEQTDIVAAIDMLNLDKFAVLGTSRGGLHALLMGQVYSVDRMAAVVFNDIGPKIEMSGLRRIADSLDRPSAFRSFGDVAELLQQSLEGQFPKFKKDDWLKLSKQLASEKNGQIVFDYDPDLARQLDSLDDNQPLPELWDLYQPLTDRPVLVLRGEHSDLLGKETCRRMMDQHSNAQFRTIPDHGHAPVLWEPDTHAAIAKFLLSI
ncbi:MAG: alpha/beta hydrolase [Roseibium sp.]